MSYQEDEEVTTPFLGVFWVWLGFVSYCGRRGGGDSISRFSFEFGLVCILLRKIRSRRIPEDEIRFFLFNPSLGGASRVVRGHVEMCLQRVSWDSVDVSLWWIHLDLVFVCVFIDWIFLIYATLYWRQLLLHGLSGALA